MGFFDSIIEVATGAIQSVKETSLPVRLFDKTLNQIAGALLDEDGEIKSLRIAMHEGWCQADAHVIHDRAEFDTSVTFEIVRFELSKESQMIELRQRGRIETAANGWRNKIAVAVMKVFVSAFLGRNLLQWGLKGTSGVSVSGNTITVDLARVGAKDALFGAVAEKVGSAAPYLLPLIQNGAGKLADYVAISDAECREGELVVNLRYLG